MIREQSFEVKITKKAGEKLGLEVGSKVIASYKEHIQTKTIINDNNEEVEKEIVEEVSDKKINNKKVKDFLINKKDNLLLYYKEVS